MQEVARILCGSHLYGTALSSSDRDYKVVYIPSPREILLCQAENRCSTENGDDIEYMSLQQYMKLLCQGQTNALDMLFAPDEAHVQPCHPAWRSIQARAPSTWVSRECNAFVGYCRQQANKYVAKSERYDALVRVVAYLGAIRDELGPEARLLEVMGGSKRSGFVDLSALTEIVDIRLQSGHSVPHLAVCDLKVPLTAKVRVALETYRRRAEKYGNRVRGAGNSSEDWKAMYHAVRVANEAIELLETGKLTFPRPEAELLLAIRKGEVPSKEAGSLISVGLSQVEKALADSKLRETPDWAGAEGLVVHFYGAAVTEAVRQTQSPGSSAG